MGFRKICRELSPRVIRQNVIPVVIIAALTVTGCEQGSQAPSLSLDEAKEVTAAFAGSDFTPPPRSIQDITAMFEDSRSDTDHLIRLRKVADREPPASKHPNTLAAFYLKRARASRDIGRTQQLLNCLAY